MRERTIGTERHRLGGAATLACAVGGLGLVLGGCAALFDPWSRVALMTSRTTFSGDYTCPDDRVVASFAPTPSLVPPADVAADPDRLALYNRQKEDALSVQRVVNVTGCGQTQTYYCGPAGTENIESCTPVMPDGGIGLQFTTATRTVNLVAPGGIADRLGFKVGDVLVAVDHQPVTDTTAQLVDTDLTGHPITVQRGGTQVEITIPKK